MSRSEPEGVLAGMFLCNGEQEWFSVDVGYFGPLWKFDGWRTYVFYGIGGEIHVRKNGFARSFNYEELCRIIARGGH